MKLRVSALLLCLCPTLRAATYYVAPSGDDDAAGTEAQPFQTLHQGASVLTPGDTLLVRAGTYAEEFYNDIPGGTSWSEPVTLAAYPGEQPVIQPAVGATRVFTFASASVSYVVIRGFVLDATNTQVDAIKITWGSSDGASHHIRIQDCEVFGAPGQGILLTGDDTQGGLDVTGNEFVNLDVHDNGTTDFDHGFYISTAGNLVEGCSVHANAGWGIHVYNGSANDADANIIRNNQSHDNAAAGERGVGIGIYSGSGNLAYNNLIWGNKSGIAVDYSATDSGVYNNVVFDNLEGGVVIGQESTGAIVRNNAIWQNGSGIADSGSGTVQDHNLVDSDPGVVDVANHDFRPTATSPLVDQSVAIAEVTADFDGVVRPQGDTYDIGAYEYCSTDCGGAAGAAGSGGSANGGSPGTAGSGGGKTASPNEATDDGGCGCRMMSNDSGSFWLLLAAMGALAGHRAKGRGK
jgi:parallel beta-helix repeat protein